MNFGKPFFGFLREFFGFSSPFLALFPHLLIVVFNSGARIL